MQQATADLACSLSPQEQEGVSMGNITRFRRARRGSSTKRPRRRVRLPHLLGLAVAVGAVGGFLLFEVSATPGGDRSVLLTLWDKLGNLAGSAVDATGLDRQSTRLNSSH